MSSPAPDVLDKRALRRQLRRQRRALSPRQQKHAAQRLAELLAALPELRRAHRLSLYLPVQGEIDPLALLPWLRRRRVAVYLPVLRPFTDNRLWFVRFDSDTPMVKNRFGIPEPHPRFGARARNRLPAWALDTLIVPLVGFDENAHRMGMGGGFYDRTLAFMRRPYGPKPALIGVAHELQKVDCLPLEPWDVPLSAVATDEAVYRAQA